ncbi:M20 family metallopeptidase [Actinocorallia libanotica]|uniref:M20 family metallopeptidase n=1 Tax=Actinocorallia libanotica TaxID=46162 RepID=A0ABP4AVF4_9ACTN
MFTHDDAVSLGEELSALRRELHREPEVGLDLPRTQERVLRALDGLPLEVTTGKGLSSVTAVLRGGRPGPSVLLRADMDALPIQEDSGVDYASRLPGAMHACGHDLHVAGLVGAARLLSAHREELAGDVVFMFQPGEEGYGGAEIMIEEGLLDAAGDPPVAAYAVHVFSTGMPAGFVGSRGGTFMASSDSFDVRVVGKGGHGSSPHAVRDPIPPLCEIVTTLQTRVARSINVLDPAVVTVGTLRAGTARNVIPEDGLLEATVRTFSEQARQDVRELVMETVAGIASAYRVEAEVDYRHDYPVTVNSADEARFALDVAGELFEGRTFESPQPIPGSEDFSYVLQKVPGAMLFLSACPPVPDPAAAPMNHAPQAVFDDSVLPDAALLLATLAARRLEGAAE